MRRQILPGLLMVVVFTLLTGVAYPLLVTCIAQGLFHDKANGSIVHGVGSRLVGQQFAQPRYFHPRPSAVKYDPTLSGGSNKGPTNADWLAEVAGQIAAYRSENGLPGTATVPVDAVTASGSGLDPDISVANARLQAARVATTRGLALDVVLRLVADHTEQRTFGLLGEPRVNVLTLNLALDKM